MQIKPAGYRVLVLPDPIKELDEFEKNEDGSYTTKTGLFVASSKSETAKDLQREANAQIFGTLIAVGPTAWKAYDDGEPWANVGDRVSYSKYGGKIITDPDTEISYVLLNDNDITAIVA